ncbi:MAG: hypothetical protein ABIP75_14020 [Pyrinomonadaceae bacterium]
MEQNQNLAELRTVVVSGVTSGSGKTSLAVAVISYLRQTTAVSAAKLTVTHGDRGCPHGGKGCNVCSSLGGDYQIISRFETIAQKDTDTARFLEAGAAKVLWGITRDVSIGAMWEEMARSFTRNECVVIESNTLALTIKPTLNIMIVDPTVSRRLWKPSAVSLISSADIVIFNDRGELTAVRDEVARLRREGEVILLANPAEAAANPKVQAYLNRVV